MEVIKALKDDPRLIEIEIEERKQKLEERIADKAHARDMEMRRTIAEEKVSMERAKADFERSKADQLTANAQLKMMELFTRNMHSENR